MLAFLLLVFVASVKSQSCTGDFNQNGEVDILDLSYILDRFGTCPPGVCLGDLTGNQIRNQGDVIVLTSLWGPCFPNQTTRIGTFPPDPTTTTRVSTTTATTATTRTTAPTATLAPVITAPPVENTTQWTTSSSTTFSPDAAVLSFEPPISENCRRVEPGAYLVYWTSRVNEGAGNCEGNPVVLVRGDATNDYCFVNEYSTASSWLTDLTFLACAAGRGALCAWTATISTTSSVLDTGLKYLCTTGSLDGPPGETWNGTNKPSYQPDPIIPGNEFAHGPLFMGLRPQLTAPFQIGNCLKPGVVNGLYRSYRAYCSLDQVPAQWRNLPLANSPFQH